MPVHFSGKPEKEEHDAAAGNQAEPRAEHIPENLYIDGEYTGCNQENSQ